MGTWSALSQPYVIAHTQEWVMPRGRGWVRIHPSGHGASSWRLWLQEWPQLCSTQTPGFLDFSLLLSLLLFTGTVSYQIICLCCLGCLSWHLSFSTRSPDPWSLLWAVHLWQISFCGMWLLPWRAEKDRCLGPAPEILIMGNFGLGGSSSWSDNLGPTSWSGQSTKAIFSFRKCVQCLRGSIS